MTTAAPGTSAGALRAAGLRATVQRTAVLDVLRAALAAGDHLSAAEVAARARRTAALSTQATYDVLEALVGAGLARRVRPADAASAVYEARVGDNHHHVVCRGCGATADVDCATGAAPCAVPAAASLPAGFVVDEAEMTFWGWCAPCAARRPHPATPSPPTTRTTTTAPLEEHA